MYRDRPGHPVVVHRSVFGLLERAEGDVGLGGILRQERLPFLSARVGQSAPADIDTPDDYERALEGEGR